MKILASTIFLIFVHSLLKAQDKVEMADALRGSGKIYVVVAVMLVLFLIFTVYLFSIDKRLKKIEKQK